MCTTSVTSRIIRPYTVNFLYNDTVGTVKKYRCSGNIVVVGPVINGKVVVGTEGKTRCTGIIVVQEIVVLGFYLSRI